MSSDYEYIKALEKRVVELEKENEYLTKVVKKYETKLLEKEIGEKK